MPVTIMDPAERAATILKRKAKFENGYKQPIQGDTITETTHAEWFDPATSA